MRMLLGLLAVILSLGAYFAEGGKPAATPDLEESACRIEGCPSHMKALRPAPEAPTRLDGDWSRARFPVATRDAMGPDEHPALRYRGDFPPPARAMSHPVREAAQG